MRYAEFVQIDRAPGRGEVLASFQVEPVPGVTILEAAGAVAAETSVGTWTEVGRRDGTAGGALRARVYEVRGPFVRIAYPADLFEPGNLPALLNVLIGDVFGLRCLRRLRLVDVHLPEALVESFPGPLFGAGGVRARLGGVFNRPLVAAVLKPRLGLTPLEQAALVEEALANGCDVVEDDEKLAGQGGNPFYDRVPRCLEAQRRAEARTGRRLGYVPNVTAPVGEMLRRARFVARHGGRWVAVDVLAAGWSAVQELREAAEALGLIVHANRAAHAVLTRTPGHGVSMLALGKLCRLAGVDELHIDPVWGKTGGDAGEARLLQANLTRTAVEPARHGPCFPQQWGGMEPVLPVVSGGLSPLLLPQVWDLFGNDVMIQLGGGIHGHPMGTGAGARAVRQALEAAMNGTPLTAQAERHAELRIALEVWRAASLRHQPAPPPPRAGLRPGNGTGKERRLWSSM